MDSPSATTQRTKKVRGGAPEADPAESAVTTAGAQCVRRAVGLLRIVAAHSGRGASLSEVSRGSGLSKATTHRLLRVLFEEALLEYDVETRRYRLGVEVFSLGAAMGEQFNVERLAQPSLQRLADETEDTVYLAVRSGFDALCVDMREGRYPEKALRLHVRDRWPLGVGAFSVALLAYLPDVEVRRVVEHNARRLGEAGDTATALLGQVAQTRRRGYAVTRLTQYPTMCAVAVPVLDAFRRPIASLCVTAILARMGTPRQRETAQRLRHEASIVAGAWESVRSVRPQSDGWWSVAASVKAVE